MAMAATESHHRIDAILHYFFPISILAYYIIASVISVCTLQKWRASNGQGAPRKFSLGFEFSVLVSYVAEACLLLIDTIAKDAQNSSTDANVYTLSSALLWMIFVGSLLDAEKPVWYPYYGSWFISLASEIVLISLGVAQESFSTTFSYARLALRICRILFLVLLQVIFWSFKLSKPDTIDEESAPLLVHKQDCAGDANPIGVSSGYGSISLPSPDDEDPDEDPDEQKQREERKLKTEKRLRENGNWFTYARGFSIFIPYVWPSNQRRLQLNMLGVALCLSFERALNVLEPRQFGIVLDRLSHGRIPIAEAALYIFYRWIQSSALSPVRQMLWLPVEQYSYKAITTAAYDHVMRLSRDFHDNKDSGSLYASIDQGTTINDLLEAILFDVAPILVDAAVAYIYLYCVFGPYMALIVAATAIIYLWASTYFTAKQVGPRRRFQSLARKENQVRYETMGSWNTVSYFNRLAYEQERYSKVIKSRLAAWWKMTIFYHATDSLQSCIVDIGLFGAGLLAMYQIVTAQGELKVGNYAMLMSLWGGFVGNLSYFKYAHRHLLSNLVDAESLLELFETSPTVKDGSSEFSFDGGDVDFDGVEFSYDGQKETIKDFNFYAKPGQRIALVGATGSGKSTILKLLFRFYDVRKGAIKIDGQDIRNVTLESLRQCIGVVPQDPSLFNDTIMNNVRYARLEATDEEVMEACKSAAIHEKILTFTNGYATKVGENGDKVSGGELQRIAIARVILKDPKIILLDEATSAVDTETESLIQDALQKLTKGRTTFTVAHRLSTVTNSDIILVVKDGTILEQGSPHQLREAKGKFWDLWIKQSGVISPPDDDAKPSEAIKRSSTSLKEDRKGPYDMTSSEGKSLRPDAPEFIPRNKAVNGRSLSEGNIFKGKGRAKRKMESSTEESGRTSDTLVSDSQPTTGNATTNSLPQEKKQKRNNLSEAQRRLERSSEPTGSAIKYDQSDVAGDEPPAHGSKVGLATRIKPRRVSAPGGPQSGAANSHKVGGGQRRRRQRHRRLMKKGEASALGSEAVSGEVSEAWSSDNIQALQPGAPTTTPNGRASSTNESKDMADGSGIVHFAPGV